MIASIFNWCRRLPTRCWTMVVGWRPALAITWRSTCKYAFVLLGYACFAGLQLFAAKEIVDSQLYLLFVVIGATVLMILLARWPYAACVVWLFGSPYAKYFLAFKLGKGIPLITFDGVIIPSVGVVLLLRALRHRRPFAKPNIAEVFIVLFAVYVLMNKTFRWELTQTTARNFVLYSFGFWVLIYHVFKAALKTRTQLAGIMVAAVVAAAFAGVTFIYEAAVGKSFYSIMVGQDIGMRSYAGMERSTGVFADQIEPGHLLATAAVFALHFLGHTRKQIGKLFYSLSVIAIAIGCFYTFTRVNWLGFLIGMIVMMVFARGRAKFFRVVVPLSIVAAIGCILIMMSDPKVSNRVTADTVTHRGIFAQTAMNVIRHNLWFGVGWLNAPDATREYVVSRAQYEGGRDENGQPVPTLVHNSILQITQENGLIGAFLYYGAIILFLLMALRLWARAPANDILGKDFIAALIASVVVWLASSQTSDASKPEFLYANGVLMLVFAAITRLGYLWRPQADAPVAVEPKGELLADQAALTVAG